MEFRCKARIKCDVLVIGGGFGGFWAAIKAKEKAERVILVDKSFAGKAGHSRFAFGGMVVFLPDDDIDAWVKDITEANEWIADQEEIEKILMGSYERLKDFEAMGLEFPGSNGIYARFPSRGTRHVQDMRFPPGGGAEIMLTLRKEALRRGVEIRDHIFISNLLNNGQGGAGGAVGISIRNGEFYVFQANAVVIATNSGGFRGHHLASDQQGTGVFLAYELGATLRNAEFHYINIRPSNFEIEGSGIFPVFGGRWVNVDGETFMDRYNFEFRDRASNHRILIAMAQEAKAGRSPIAMDTPSMSAEGRERFRANWVSHGWMALLYRKLKREYRDFLMEKVDWKPAYESNRTGILTDIRCAAEGVPGLFAAGMAKSFDPVALTGWSIARCIWSGYTAGYHASIHSSSAAEFGLLKQDIEKCKENLLLPLRRKEGVSPDKVNLEIQRILFPYDVMILQKEDRLKEALDKIEKLKEKYIPCLAAKDIHELVKVKETETMILGAEMTLRSALTRKESRPNIFYREDYPSQDNQNWLRWIVLKKKNRRMEFETRLIPFDRYKFKPPKMSC